jgi:hypothetical protein
MRNLDALFKLVVPAIFLLFWALGQVLNKEIKPPLRPMPGPPPGGRDPAGEPFRPPAPPASPQPARPARPPEILILETRSTEPPRGGRSRRTARSKPAAPAPPAPAPRPGLVSLATRLDSPPSSQTDVAARVAPAPPHPALAALREALTTPERTRQALLVAAILGPPAALRHRR